MSSYKQQPNVELEVYVEHTTDKALKCIKVEDLDDDSPKEFWLPLSKVEILEINHEKSWYKLEVPEWLALKLGLI